ncbi:MAG TPA: chitobiase/beta-hexosaminidase C-terminal domain-containing protein, partial [Chitinivibrionales bacterium]
PTTSSAVYTAPLTLKGGQTLRYFAIDKSGNRSPVKIMDELQRPLVSAFPRGGIFNKRIKIDLSVSPGATAFFRLPPDSVLRAYNDSIVLKKEGGYSLEYYSENAAGLRSAIRQNEYVVDLTPPHVAINVKKGNNDSVIVFFECTKNATIYYTIDGTSPFYSQTTRTRGNKFLLSKDRLGLFRKPGADIKLAFYAEDVAGNQSTLTVLDVFKPMAVPNVPAGADIIYDRILSISLNTFDDRSQIYYARHGQAPTLDSATFSTPLTLVRSDTLIAFVVDAAGYRGEPDTFVYRIDLPPSPDFAFLPDSIVVGTSVNFDATGTVDHESRFDKLLFRWRFTAGGSTWTDFKPEPRT